MGMFFRPFQTSFCPLASSVIRGPSMDRSLQVIAVMSGFKSGLWSTRGHLQSCPENTVLFWLLAYAHCLVGSLTWTRSYQALPLFANIFIPSSDSFLPSSFRDAFCAFFPADIRPLWVMSVRLSELEINFRFIQLLLWDRLHRHIILFILHVYVYICIFFYLKKTKSEYIIGQEFLRKNRPSEKTAVLY